MSLKKQFLWSLAPLVVVSAANIFSVPLFYHYLGAELYAIWLYVTTFTGIFGFADLGLGVAVGRFIGVALGKGDRDAVQEYWGTGNLIAIPLLGLMALVFIGIGLALGPKILNVSPQNFLMLRLCFVSGGLALFASFYGQFWAMMLQAHLDFAFASALRVAITLGQVLPGIAIAFWTHSPFLVTVWTLALTVVQLMLLIWHARRHYGLGLGVSSARWARAHEMAAFTGKTFAMLVFNSVFGSIDRIIVGKFAPAASFTHYTIAANTGSRLQSLGTSIMGPVFHNTNQALGGGRTSAAALIYNETFQFLFHWYLLASLWVAVWHPLLLRLWLGRDLAAQIAPLLVPVVIACSISAIANISAAQLSALNRLGTALGFTIATAASTAAGVALGWVIGGTRGVAYGFLCSRVVLLAQDLFAIRLMRAGGWLSLRTWTGFLAQAAVAGAFSLPSLWFPHTSAWLLIPAILHGLVVSAWLVRHTLRKWLSGKSASPRDFEAAVAKEPLT